MRRASVPDFDTGITSRRTFRNEKSPPAGQELIAEAFPAGANAPTDVIVAGRARMPARHGALAAAPEVSAVRPLDEQGPPGVRLDGDA